MVPSPTTMSKPTLNDADRQSRKRHANVSKNSIRCASSIKHRTHRRRPNGSDGIACIADQLLSSVL